MSQPKRKEVSKAILTKIILLVAFMALPMVTPWATAAQDASNVVPTNLAGVTTTLAPPPGFDPLIASDDELATYGFPPRPDPMAAPQAYSAWARAMAASKVRVFPQLKQTNIRHESNRKAFNSGHEVTDGVSYSSNWSGPVAFGGATTYGTNSFWYTVADFVVPVAEQPLGACTGGWDHAAAWTGIDGDGSTDVLQAGVEFDAYCSGNTNSSSYYPWYEWYPANALSISSLPVTAGDEVYVQVSDITATVGAAFVLNQNTNQYVSIMFSAPGTTQLIGNSAEWIVEYPSFSGSTGETNYTQDFFADSYAVTFNHAQFDAGNASSLVDMTDSNGCVQSFPTVFGSSGIWFQDENGTRFAGGC